MDAHWETVFHLAADYEVRDVKKGGLACTPPPQRAAEKIPAAVWKSGKK